MTDRAARMTNSKWAMSYGGAVNCHVTISPPGYPLPLRSTIPCTNRPESAPTMPTLVGMNVNPPNVNSGRFFTVHNA